MRILARRQASALQILHCYKALHRRSGVYFPFSWVEEKSHVLYLVANLII